MVRPSTPRRGPERTLRVLRALKQRHGGRMWFLGLTALFDEADVGQVQLFIRSETTGDFTDTSVLDPAAQPGQVVRMGRAAVQHLVQPATCQARDLGQSHRARRFLHRIVLPQPGVVRQQRRDQVPGIIERDALERLLKISDKDGGSTDLTTTVEVTHVAPTARLVLPAAPVYT